MAHLAEDCVYTAWQQLSRIAGNGLHSNARDWTLELLYAGQMPYYWAAEAATVSTEDLQLQNFNIKWGVEDEL